MAIAAKAFKAPVPSFGPGSLECMRLKEEEGSAETKGSVDHEDAKDAQNAAGYAGAGAYY